MRDLIAIVAASTLGAATSSAKALMAQSETV